ncbi:MAG: hypothetical protein HYU62_14525 [Caulobacterales bacterium]|nr:hypothetical protein [Caulobacterales bacterium]
MKRIFIAALALALSAGGALAQTSPRPMDDPAYVDEVRCVVVYMALLAEGSEEAGASVGLQYYAGRLEGRYPGVDWTLDAWTVATDAGLGLLAEHSERCARGLLESAVLLRPLDTFVQQWARGDGQMGAALQAFRKSEGR